MADDRNGAPRPRRGPTLRGVLANRHALSATCQSCWHQNTNLDPRALAAAYGEDMLLEEIAKRMVCKCGAKKCALSVRVP